MSFKYNIGRRLPLLTPALFLVLGSLAPVLTFVNGSTVSAAQVTERKITISSSVVSATSTQYDVSFKPATSTGNGSDDILGIVVDFCSNSPLVGQTCTHPAGMSGVPTAGNIAVTHSGATGSPVSFAVQDPAGGGDDGARLLLTHGTGLDVINTSNVITFSITGITNPSGVGTFYARILTYNTGAGATSYTDTVPGTHLDDGGVALSTANQLTVNARVQETLSFCVGTTTVNDATTSVAADCSGAFTGTCGTTVDLGVIDSSAISTSPVPTAAGTPGGGNACNGAAMVRTNAANGTVVSFYAEADSGGTNHTRALRVDNATCTADGTPSTSTTDQCFNSQGGTQGTFTAGTERFGMTLGGINCGSNGGTNYTCSYGSGNVNLAPQTNYIGGAFTQGTSGTYGVGSGYAWPESGTATNIASSASSPTKVIEDEVLMLRFAATSNITTPTGLYFVTSTYIATSTF